MASLSETQFFTSVSALGSTLHERLKDASSVVVIADENTSDHCFPLLAENCEAITTAEIIVVPPGEPSKSIEICLGIWQTLLELRADRNSVIINLGGGVVSDLGGFVAGTFKRGIAFINVPTSLMAMADAAIGGKSGIDFENHKNIIGLFNPPESVLVCPVFLDTLSESELKSGFAEMIKHALLQSEERWKEISSVADINVGSISGMLEKSANFKQKIVSLDPHEKGLRKMLNFGHTIGHAIESHFLCSGNIISHGHAIARGLIAEAWMSHQLAGLGSNDFDSIETYINRHFPAPSVAKGDTEKIISFMSNDKKNKCGEIRFVLLESPGNPVFDQTAGEEVIITALNKALIIV